MTSLRAVAAAALAAALFVPVTNARAALACEDMRKVQVTDVTIDAVSSIVPDPTWSPEGSNGVRVLSAEAKVPFCRVEGHIEEEIAFELWLPPEDDWNGRYLGAGNGGDAGFINYRELVRGIGRGFASASTDTGHTRAEPRWGLNRPDRLENFGYRAHHLLARSAKDLIEAYYGKKPSYSYFSGCSGGGLQGMNEAQRYPADYDGIMSGASGRSMVGISARWLMSGLLAERKPEGNVSADEWRQLAAAAHDYCDAKDGIEDGVIGDPQSCDFDPDMVDWLTEAQVERVRAIMAPIETPDGEVLFEGFEPGIAFSPLDNPDGVPARSFGDWTYHDPNWDPRTFKPERDIPENEARVPGLRIANPDLTSFARVGGKLITYIGWLDAIVPAAENIAYADSVRNHMGEETTDEFFRMFLVPGMEHCRGGPGADMFGQPYAGDAPVVDAEHDLLTAIMRWVEDGVAPDYVIASKVEDDGRVSMTRRLCPYPKVAVYDGSGDESKASSYRCE